MMKGNTVKMKKGDDSLFGLLASYKSNIAYFRVLVSNDEDRIEIQLTDNPGNWKNLVSEKYRRYRVMRRLEVGVDFLLVKYLNAMHLVRVLGPYLGMKLPQDQVSVLDELNENGIYHISTSLKYKIRILQCVRKIVNFKPQKKYEILEKSIIQEQENGNV